MQHAHVQTGRSSASDTVLRHSLSQVAWQLAWVRWWDVVETLRADARDWPSPEAGRAHRRRTRRRPRKRSRKRR